MRLLDAQPGIFVSELDAIANSEIDIDVGRVGDGLIAVEKGHVSEVDFPIKIAGRAWIVGVVRRPSLCRTRQRERGPAYNEKQNGEYAGSYPRVEQRNELGYCRSSSRGAQSD
jgi:hypothetical protein